MNNRLREIINYKTKGKQKPFADIVGWSPQYLGKLLHGDDFGLKPVRALLTALPEINARWFLLGQGTMLDGYSASELHRDTVSHIQKVLDLERFLPVMTAEEQKKYRELITGQGNSDFDEETRARWLERILEREQERDTRVEEAISKSE